MISALPHPVQDVLASSEGEPPLYVVESDIDSQGQYGQAWLIATRSEVLRVEKPSDPEAPAITVARYPLDELTHFAYEELVDAGAITAVYQGNVVELLRATAGRSTSLPREPNNSRVSKQDSPSASPSIAASVPNANAPFRKIPTSARTASIGEKPCEGSFPSSDPINDKWL